MLNFTTPPALGAYPFNLGVVADVGQTDNSSMTMQRLADSQPQAFLFVGDWMYADNWLTNGKQQAICGVMTGPIFGYSSCPMRQLVLDSNLRTPHNQSQ